MKRIVALAALSLFFSYFPNHALAQSLGNAGTVQGVVSDPSGAGVPQATVTILNRITNYRRTTTTDSKGAFRFSNVPPNPYHVEVSASGFANSPQDVDVRGAVPIELNMKLALAGVKTTVNVEVGGADLLENVPYAHNDVDTKTLDQLPIS